MVWVFGTVLRLLQVKGHSGENAKFRQLSPVVSPSLLRESLFNKSVHLHLFQDILFLLLVPVTIFTHFLFLVEAFITCYLDYWDSFTIDFLDSASVFSYMPCSLTSEIPLKIEQSSYPVCSPAPLKLFIVSNVIQGQIAMNASCH